MKKRILAIVLTLALLLALPGCSGSGGTPPVFTLGGTDLTLGESSPGTVSVTEYQMSLPGKEAIGMLPKKTWLSEFIIVKKDKETYAYLYVYNPTSQEVPVLSATIYKLSFKMNSEENDYWAKDNILVNGINFYGMDTAAAKEAVKDYKVEELDTGTLRINDGKYRYFIRFDDAGIVEEVQVEFEIPKSFS